MTFSNNGLKIRAKKLGVLIRDARLAARKETAECAQAIGVSREGFESFEMGEASPSFPEMEILAYYLNVPLEHFWGNELLKKNNEPLDHVSLELILGLRQRMIGVYMRKMRQEARMSSADLASQIGISVDDLQAYELGDKAAPFPVLEQVAYKTGRTLREFQDVHGPLGSWFLQQRATQEFKDLSPDLQSFVCKPINTPYLELAQRLSEMSVEKLRGLAEGLLEITL
jgi:transcriptional regulator with XRE-family HTH domain